VSVTKPAQRHKYDTKTAQSHKNKTLNRKNKSKMTGKMQYLRGTKVKPLKPENNLNYY